MSDWADEKAKKIVEWVFGSSDPRDAQELAAALRKAREDALEEAARVAEMYPAAMIGGPDAYCRGHIAACTQNAAAIRALKEKTYATA